jgi:single-stranded DNA-specific DHH superfamily exonuclease
MGIVVAMIVAGLLIYWLVGMRKMARWNNDPRSQKLIQLFLAAGRSGDLVDEIKITNFLAEQGDWSLSEDRRRVAHALTAVERISDRSVSERARDIGLSIGRTINAGQLRGV